MKNKKPEPLLQGSECDKKGRGLNGHSYNAFCLSLTTVIVQKKISYNVIVSQCDHIGLLWCLNA